MASGVAQDGPTVVLYEGTSGVRVRRSDVVIMGVSSTSLVDVAADQAARGAARIELCGGISVVDAARVRRQVGGAARVGLNRYGFESLELAVAYKRAYEAGDVGPAVFLFASTAETDTAPHEHEDGTFQQVVDLDHAERLGVTLARRGAGLVELYAGLGTAYAAAVLRGADGALPVGVVGYDD